MDDPESESGKGHVYSPFISLIDSTFVEEDYREVELNIYIDQTETERGWEGVYFLYSVVDIFVADTHPFVDQEV